MATNEPCLRYARISVASSAESFNRVACRRIGRPGPAVQLDRLAHVGPGWAVDDGVPGFCARHSTGPDQTGDRLHQTEAVRSKLPDDLVGGRPALDQCLGPGDRVLNTLITGHRFAQNASDTAVLRPFARAGSIKRKVTDLFGASYGSS